MTTHLLQRARLGRAIAVSAAFALVVLACHTLDVT